MSRTTNYLLLAFMLILTILYCCFIYLGMGLYLHFLKSQGIEAISNVTVVTCTSPLLWQILAVVSFVLNSFFAIFSSRKKRNSNPFVTAAALHVSWIFICLLVHGIGCLLPFFMWVPVLE